MDQSICSIEECNAPRHARGWCNMHYKRWKLYGNPTAPRKPKTMGYRFSRLKLGSVCDRGHMMTEQTMRTKARGTRECIPCFELRKQAREQRPCEIDGCKNPRTQSHYCSKHHARWSRNGDPLVSLHHRESDHAHPMDWDSVIGACVTQHSDTGCWTWDRARNKYGYGVLTYKGSAWYAHRVSYTIAVGEIPEDMTVDHICWVRSCVRPSHLQLLTLPENTRRQQQHLGDEVEWVACPRCETPTQGVLCFDCLLAERTRRQAEQSARTRRKTTTKEHA